MPVSMVIPAKSGRRVLGRIMQRLARGSNETVKIDQKSNLNYSRVKRQIWTMKDTDPAVAAVSYEDAPVKVGDLVYVISADEAFICSVAPASGTAAEFIQLHD